MELRSEHEAGMVGIIGQSHAEMTCRGFHHRRQLRDRIPPCRPHFLSDHRNSNSSSKRRCHCLMNKYSSPMRRLNSHPDIENEMNNESFDHLNINNALQESNFAETSQSHDHAPGIESAWEKDDPSRITTHNDSPSTIRPSPSSSDDSCQNSLSPGQFPFCHRRKATVKRLEERRRRRPRFFRSPFKLPARNDVIISPFKCSKMIGLLLFTVLSTSMIATVPVCQASALNEWGKNVEVKANGSRIEGGHTRGGSNFGVNHSPTQWVLAKAPTTSDMHKQGGQSTPVHETSSHLSNGPGNISNHKEVARNGSTDVSGNVLIPPPHNEDRKSPSTRTKTDKTVASSSSLVGVPFVRAHSTGFISFVTGDGTTKGSSVGALTTGGKVVKITPQLVGVIGGEEASSRLLRIGPCLCWNTTDDGHTLEVECKCTGPEMINVVSSLPSDIHRLTVEQAANFTTLTNEDLRPYGSSLNELVLSELPALRYIKNGSFVGLKELNTIYIHGTPALTQISNAVFNVYLPELKIIRIVYSALEVVPNLSKLHIKTGAALHMVELENNKISRIMPGSFEGLVTEHLALSYNELEEIGPKAFEGATIARLTLKGNPLKTLHSESFVGIDSLRVLDLSETQITYLPTKGLNALESLRLEKVWTLSVIPSIYHFQELEEAWLTWPYHCCAFAYPETHDPVAFQSYKEYVRTVVNELCAKASANASTEIPEEYGEGVDVDTNNDGATGSSTSSQSGLIASMNSQRQKRHLRLVDQTNALRGISALDDDDSANTVDPRRGRMRDKDRKMMMYRKRDKENTQAWNSMGSIGYNNIISRNNKDYKAVRALLLSQRLIANEPMSISTSDPHQIVPSSFRLRKRSVNGHHPRQTQKNNANVPANDGKVGSGMDEEVNKDSDGFHHPHVLQSNSGGFSEGDFGNHPFDTEDEFGAHYEKMGHDDEFDPFVFDPDRSFSPILGSDDLEQESDILGKNPWGTFGQASEVEFDEEVGIFHPSVTPSPTVITLCGNVAVKKPPKIACHPLPDAFNPCEDIMGSIWLRGAVWVVVALALFGNTAVLVVLLLAPGRISVQRFLMANLSWADLCMGIYLLMVATQDLVSLGSYFNYAIDWQLGWGCQIAGFLTVFASELSVFTLAVITGERWYALTRAIHLTKRLTLLGASQLMAFGWFMAILLAALPLMGVSSYSKTSICLPMGADSDGAVVYLIFLLLFNGVAFLLVACAYWHMYRAVAGHGGSGTGASPAASAADTAIAKKMALLVFTDFACWAPVAFFGLTAVGGMPLIGVTDSKILLVFFYPLNACCNPYLYAILTKQYRRDLLLLLSRHGMCTKRAARYKTGAASTNNTMQTMQTVLRMGSMTETKVAAAGSSGAGRGGLLNGGRLGSVSIAEKTLLEDEEGHGGGRKPIIPSIPEAPPSSSSQENKYKNNLQQLNQSPNLRAKARGEDEDDDVFDLNGLSGRHIAETTFISIPLSPAATTTTNGKKKAGESTPICQNGDPAKEKLIQHRVEQHHYQSNNKQASSTPSVAAGGGKLSPGHNNSNSTPNSHLIRGSSGKEENDLDHEITETTPFCTTVKH